ncbi:probable linoleate 9S-lipoxygenase 5 [Tanacetum coccineum]
MVQTDSELQSWWTELRTEGHGDKKDEPWWPKLQTVTELIDTCTIIIWVASALHAAVNFGQYTYAGYLPNRPTVSRRFMPKPGSPEYAELESDPEKAFLKTITSQLQTLLGVSLIEILSRHSTDEIYLGQNESPYWTSDGKALEAFEEFGKKLMGIEEMIMIRNNDVCLKNRNGPVNVSYTLLYPNTCDTSKKGGLTGKGIPNTAELVMLLKHDAGDFVPDTSFDISASLEYVSGLVHASLAKVVRCVSLSVAPEETIPHHVPQSSIGKSSCRF